MQPPNPNAPADLDTTRIIERPDGFYLQNKETGEESGPFATLMEAEKAMEIGADTDIEVGESTEEAQDEVGIADWIDPETGMPAEDGVPRIEDH